MTEPGQIHPSALRPPTAWLLPRVSTRTTPEGFTETVTAYVATDPEAVRLAAEKVLASLKASPRAEPPKVDAAQLVAHHVLFRESLPALVLEALAAAMSLNRRPSPRVWPGVGEAVEAARKATAVWPPPKKEKKPGAKRTPQSDERKYRAIVFDVVRWFTERGGVLPGEVFHAVVVTLGLTEHGRLRQWVVEQITPSPQPEARLVGLVRVEPEDDDDDGVRAVWRVRPVEACVGLRRPDIFKAAVEFEARQRLDFATEEDEDGELDWGSDEDPTKQETPSGLLARNLYASPNTIRAWVASTPYQMAVYSRVFWGSKLSRQWRWRRGR